jgi:hypothetical protein
VSGRGWLRTFTVRMGLCALAVAGVLLRDWPLAVAALGGYGALWAWSWWKA